ncbi:MAG: hypothetical protein JWR23_2059 [Mucilaginibacter sp.]|nr:hypothetical protein [Mucilaginibacter sp.]
MKHGHIEIIKERRKCHKCGKGELDTRIRRGILVKQFLFWLPIKHYRCNTCWGKTYILGSVWRIAESHENSLITT